jgi:hypothetical protein
MPKEGDFQWNLGKKRVEFIGEVTNKLRGAYAMARLQKDQGSCREYFTFIDTLYMTLRPYIEDVDVDKVDVDFEDEEMDSSDLKSLLDNLIDQIDAETDSLKGRNAPKQLIEKMRTVDLIINEIRIALNLDIPRDLEFDPDEEGVATEGL